MVFVVVTRSMAGDQKINKIQNGESENAAICLVLQTVEANEDSRFLKTRARNLIELKVIIINNCKNLGRLIVSADIRQELSRITCA